MQMKRIVVSGAPCSGKTSFIRYMQEKHPGIITIPEIASMIKATGMSYKEEEERIGFQNVVCELQKKIERLIVENNFNRNCNAILCDRGTVDTIAFYPSSFFSNQMVNLCDEDFLYDSVIFFELPDRCELYDMLKAGNIYRDEDFNASVELEKKLLELWKQHHKLNIIPFMDSPAIKFEIAEKVVLEILNVAR